ncbi:SIMPL domain-containing protein [Cardinium endosymbiont of Philonthus spinipes]|uniref:SIMPL domain-containing protein n=1 Tax=Cardinium endosymbiont of Philonthus spinipes TaxID=3077941 RepID=UPI00313AE8BD
MHEKKVKAAIVLSLGLIASSIIFSLAFWYTRSGATTYINVKGLAEREVDATIGIWSVKFESSGNDLNQVNAQIKKQTTTLINFLSEQGFTDKEIIYGHAYLDDRSKYNDADKRLKYSAEMEVTIHSPKVSLLYATVQKSQEIIQKGVFLVGSRWDRGLRFIFTDLNTIKPSMIQEATINAKKAAQQLASDSAVRLGMLRKASQGSFSIEDTDVPTRKKVRVVTQMEYAIQ